MLSVALGQHGIPATGRLPATPAVASSTSSASVDSVAESHGDLRSQCKGTHVQGLTQWLAALGLDVHADSVSTWANETGTLTLEEIAEHIDLLKICLPLKPLEVRRLERQGAVMALQVGADVGRRAQHARPSARAVPGDADVWDAAPLAPPLAPTLAKSQSLTAGSSNLAKSISGTSKLRGISKKRVPRVVPATDVQDAPGHDDEFLLRQLERREDAEVGFDARNRDTFGASAPSQSTTCWSFEEMLEANQRLEESHHAAQSAVAQDSTSSSIDPPRTITSSVGPPRIITSNVDPPRTITSNVDPPRAITSNGAPRSRKPIKSFGASTNSSCKRLGLEEKRQEADLTKWTEDGDVERLPKGAGCKLDMLSTHQENHAPTQEPSSSRQDRQRQSGHAATAEQDPWTESGADPWDQGRPSRNEDRQRQSGHVATAEQDPWTHSGTEPRDQRGPSRSQDRERQSGHAATAAQEPWIESGADAWDQRRLSEGLTAAAQDPWSERGADPWDQQRQAGQVPTTAHDPWAEPGADPWDKQVQKGPETSAAQDPWAERGADPWAHASSTTTRAPRPRQVPSNAHSEEWTWKGGGSSSSDRFKASDTAKTTRNVLPHIPLRVDKTAGAGLSLIWCEGAGYSVSDIDAWPGQPGLRVGDVICSISGVRLDTATSEKEVERRFGSVFRHGAQMEVLRRGDAPEELAATCAGPDEFKAKVRVLPAKGAGLALIWHPPEGYLIEDVEHMPGQPNLCPGDVIRAVAGASLRGFSEEAAADRALAGALADGALLQVFRPQVHARGGDIVAIPTGVGTSESAPLWVSSLALGTWSWGNDKWGHDTWGLDCGGGAEARQEVLAGAFHAALEHGSFFADTAPTYGHGFAEDMLGRMCQGGGYAVIATKYYPREADRDIAAAMVSSARKSIEKLRLDAPLDLFQLHRPAEPPTSLEAQADALAGVVQAGLARAVGVCSFLLDEIRIVHERLRRVHSIPLSTVQVELSLAHQLPVASGLVSACHEMGVAVLAYSPLGMGRLSGKHDPLRDPPLRFGRDGRQVRPFGTALDADPAAHARLLNALRETGRRYGNRTAAQVALNWVMSQGAVAISGARTRQQAQDNARAMGWRLSPEDVAALTALGARGAARVESERGAPRSVGRGAFVPEGRGRRH